MLTLNSRVITRSVQLWCVCAARVSHVSLCCLGACICLCMSLYVCVFLCVCVKVFSSFTSTVLAVCLSVPIPLDVGGERLRWGQRVKRGSSTGGVFGVSWHLGEGFQLVRDPCVHLDGFAGE